MYKKLLLTLAMICILAGQLSAAAIAYASAGKTDVPSYSLYTLQPNATLLGIKAGQFGFYFDMESNESNKSANPASALVQVVNKNMLTTKYQKQSTNPVANFISGITPTVTNNTATSSSSSTTNTQTTDPVNTPTVSATAEPAQPTAVPTQSVEKNVNLVPNPSFESVTNGFATNWTTDGGGFTLDTNSQGNNGTNSIHYLSTSNAKSHLISDRFSVVPGAYGYLRLNAKVTQIPQTPLFLYCYIDEYDANGTWITGNITLQEFTAAYVQERSVFYAPHSLDTRSIRIQIISDNPGEFYMDSLDLSLQ